MTRIASALQRGLQAWLKRRGLAEAAHSETTRIPNSGRTDLFLGPGRKLLHVGCGRATIKNAGTGFQEDEWTELRLDIDERVQPDIVGSILNMSEVPDASADALYSSHNIEHLYPHEVPLALAEFKRVLKPEGFALLTCPDLQSVCRFILDDKINEAIYTSEAGPITPLDVLFGHYPQLAAGNLYMAHHGGFTLESLVKVFQDAGFRGTIGIRRESRIDLWVLASKMQQSEETLRSMAVKYFPQD
ncbi:MAG: methyltransferase domain-containing protein [Sulfuricellaceae bacterium]